MSWSIRRAVVAVLVLVFAAAGLTKLIAPAMFHEQFLRFGLPEWWVLVTGAIEVVGAAMLVMRNRTVRRSGGAILAMTMTAATALHLITDPPAMALPAAMLLLLASYIAVWPMSEPAPPSAA